MKRRALSFPEDVRADRVGQLPKVGIYVLVGGLEAEIQDKDTQVEKRERERALTSARMRSSTASLRSARA